MILNAMTDSKAQRKPRGMSVSKRGNNYHAYYDEFLTLMERAFEVLNPEAFRNLEDKIKAEIACHRAEEAMTKPQRMYAPGATPTTKGR